MRTLTTLLLLGGLTAAAARQTAPAEDAVREEFFVLETVPEDLDPHSAESLEAPRAEARAVGLVAWRRRDDADGTLLEQDVRFPEEEARVLHIERHAQAGPTLVWREWRPDRGRTVIVEPAEQGGGFRVLEWGQEEPLRAELEADTVFPLSLLERIRAGDLAAGSVRVYDPLSGRAEPLTVREVGPAATARPAAAPVEAVEAAAGEEPAPAPRRVVELVREDGSLAGAYVLAGDGVRAFQVQAGRLRARRIEPAEYRRRLDEHPPAPAEEPPPADTRD